MNNLDNTPLPGQMTFKAVKAKPLRVLVACEESQEVCKAFRALGHQAYSCDIQECSGGHPEWHIKGNVLPLLNGYKGLNNDPTTFFWTEDGKTHTLPRQWDMIIAHPPCTYLTVTGNRWFNEVRYGEKARQRQKDRYRAIVFFMHFALADSERIVVENPVGVMGTAWRSADQIIQPWQFGDAADKQTALWLKGVQKLNPTKIVERPQRMQFASGKTMPKWYADLWHDADRAISRSKTFPGIARAMAEQWGGDAREEKYD